eukprot:13250633-Alexandrium_andersonii.AAC.1
MAPFACGSYAGGDSSTVCTPSRSATARRKSTNAGSSSVFSRTRWRCPSRRMLATAWPTVSPRKRPLHRTGCAEMAFESRCLMTRTVKDASLPSLVRKQ